MPRRARMYIPGLPYHVVQRGNNRQRCFFETENYQYYLELWRKCAQRYGARVHAYCLMTNHIHFLVTPETVDAISNITRVVGSSYAQFVNKKYQRTGTLWEGRHYASLIQSDRYLLTCYRYIELNPVRASITSQPQDYRWSSFHHNAQGVMDWIQAHDAYIALARTSARRQAVYRELFETTLSNTELALIREGICYSQPVGDADFKKTLERKYKLKLGRTCRGRPPGR